MSNFRELRKDCEVIDVVNRLDRLQSYERTRYTGNMHGTARGMTRSQDSMIDDQLSQSPPACQSITYLYAYMYSYKL